MAKSRPTTYLLIAVILLCVIYWGTKTTAPGSLYGTDFQTSKEAEELLRLDQHGRHIPSASAGQYDLETSSNQQDPIPGSEDYLEIPAEFDAVSTSTSVTSPKATQDTGFKHAPQLPSGYAAALPRQIWQSSSEAGKLKYADKMQTWIDVKGFTHNWLSDEDTDDIVRKDFASTRPSIVRFWDDLSSGIHNASKTATKIATSPDSDNSSSEPVFDSTSSSAIVLRADFLRYLLMLSRGGVYADIDTSVLVHVDQWIPIDLGSYEINAIISLEYDDNTYPMFVRPISFCQWTLAAKPNHPIFQRAVARVMSNLEYLARRQRVDSLARLKLDKGEVLEATGPGMISDVILEVIQDQLPEQDITWATFHNQSSPKLFGDILIMPVRAFAGGQKHSHAKEPAYGTQLVQHHFGRSWYNPAKAGITPDKKAGEEQPVDEKPKAKVPVVKEVAEEAANQKEDKTQAALEDDEE